MVVVDTSIIYPQEKNTQLIINNAKKNDLNLRRQLSTENNTETIKSSITSWIRRNYKYKKIPKNKFNETFNSTKLVDALKNEENKKKIMKEIEDLKQIITKANDFNIDINQDKLKILQVIFFNIIY